METRYTINFFSNGTSCGYGGKTSSSKIKSDGPNIKTFSGPLSLMLLQKTDNGKKLIRNIAMLKILK